MRPRHASLTWLVVVGCAATILLLSPSTSTIVRGTNVEGNVVPSTAHHLPVRVGGPVLPDRLSNQSGGETRLFVDTTDPRAYPTTGVRVNLSGFTLPYLDPEVSFQVGGEVVIGTYDAVFGLFENQETPLTPFYAVYNNTTDHQQRLGYWAEYPRSASGAYDFILANNGSTNWTLTMNGGAFFGNTTSATFDYGTTVATWEPGFTFYEVAFFGSTVSVPSRFVVPLALGVLEGSSWYLPEDATAYYRGVAGTFWGIEGRNSSADLAPGELLTGSQVPVGNTSGPNPLWSGGPVPITLALSAVPPEVLGLTQLTVQANASEPGVGALSGVALYFGDSLGPGFNYPFQTTNEFGSGSTNWSTPNVTAVMVDHLTVTSVLFGFVAQSTISLEIRPPIHVQLTTAGSAPNIPPGGFLNLTISARNSTGAPVPNLTLALSLVGVGALGRSSATTDASGNAAVEVYAENTATTLLVRAQVLSGGAWGAAQFSIMVVAPAHPATLSPALALGLAVAIAFGAIVLLLLIRRRPRPLPTMRLPPVRRTVEPPTSATDAPAPEPVSRTPPGSGNP